MRLIYVAISHPGVPPNVSEGRVTARDIIRDVEKRVWFMRHCAESLKTKLLRVSQSHNRGAPNKGLRDANDLMKGASNMDALPGYWQSGYVAVQIRAIFSFRCRRDLTFLISIFTFGAIGGLVLLPQKQQIFYLRHSNSAGYFRTNGTSLYLDAVPWVTPYPGTSIQIQHVKYNDYDEHQQHR